MREPQESDFRFLSKIAEHISQGAPASKSIIIDAFGGAGGNAIAFALSGRWQRIFAIEKDPNVLACGKHNAEVYGVASKIFWIQGDCLEVIKKRLKSVAKDAVIFASPPWGGECFQALLSVMSLMTITRRTRFNVDVECLC